MSTQIQPDLVEEFLQKAFDVFTITTESCVKFFEHAWGALMKILEEHLFFRLDEWQSVMNSKLRFKWWRTRLNVQVAMTNFDVMGSHPLSCMGCLKYFDRWWNISTTRGSLHFKLHRDLSKCLTNMPVFFSWIKKEYFSCWRTSGAHKSMFKMYVTWMSRYLEILFPNAFFGA